MRERSSIAKDSRVWNREEYVRLERDSFSVFVDSLPADISKRELFGLFSWTGRINDIYLSRKTRNGKIYLFAFIRYTTKGGALKAIAEMNHMLLRGKELYVGDAKYRRDASKGRRVAEVVAEGRPHHRQAEVNNAVREHTVGIQPSPNMVQGARPSALDIATHAIEEDSKKMGAMLSISNGCKGV
ncbi:polyadenylate-binding protein, cytoplasmic and nuclear-like [Arachis ipaensis]|uniref:polyadenylate-binding protein, cytoplasmic and nuclear-like n=1 Tax=Arachis ipaensis TaxID=130454 RepID=UPI0007AF9135|nr:polyadenylate-binding protein, cytoplasmic and nuclear-like [Arachis ipaensis]XP_025664616.1 polyadenylate-binding protein, cytoplasmic and nuclear-like [Arachis hypogaea]